MSNDAVVFSTADLALLARGEGPLKMLQPPARLAIFGDPVAHSASPPMQNAALREHGLPLQYVRIRVAPEELPHALVNLAKADFLGANLTIPHKQAALTFLDEVSREARLMGAINTVAVRDGKLHGFNTDGPGFAAAIREEFGTDLGSLRVLILGGAGGAGRAITVQCALEGSPSMIVANRSPEKGEALAGEMKRDLGKEVSSISLDPAGLLKAVASSDLIINATPLGMKTGEPSPLPEAVENALTERHMVYDTIYSGGTTALLKQASKAGAKSASGLSMLLHQGAKAFEIWFGKPAPLETMRAALKQGS
jgi:shikimate dehydrogenase